MARPGITWPLRDMRRLLWEDAPPSHWSFQRASSGVGNSAASNTVTTSTITPNVGDLMTLGFWGRYSGGQTSATPSDTGSGGWSTLASYQSAGAQAAQAWWKVATSADYNGGSGITVSVTSATNGGAPGFYIECDVFRLSTVQPIGVDLTAVDTVGGVGNTTLSFSPGTGSVQPGFTDELAITYMGSFNSSGPTGANNFTGTTAPLPLAEGIATNATHLFLGYAYGVQASSTAGTNVFKNTWVQSSNPSFLFGATFYYSAPAPPSPYPIQQPPSHVAVQTAATWMKRASGLFTPRRERIIIPRLAG